MVDARTRWNDRYRQADLVWSSGPNKMFASEVADLNPGSALDVACGEGRNAIWLAEQGWQVTGVDFSDVGIDKAIRRATAMGVRPEFMVGDITDMEFGSACFDLVAILYVHTSSTQRSRWLPAVAQAVKPGGRIIYIGHDPRNITEGVGGPQDPDLLPGIDDIVAGLTGFTIENTAVVQRRVETDPGHGAATGVALDTLVRAIRQPAPVEM